MIPVKMISVKMISVKIIPVKIIPVKIPFDPKSANLTRVALSAVTRAILYSRTSRSLPSAILFPGGRGNFVLLLHNQA